MYLRRGTVDPRPRARTRSRIEARGGVALAGTDQAEDGSIPELRARVLRARHLRDARNARADLRCPSDEALGRRIRSANRVPDVAAPLA